MKILLYYNFNFTYTYSDETHESLDINIDLWIAVNKNLFKICVILFLVGIFISIHCKAWAKNIKRDSSTVDFQLMIDFKD